MNVQRSHRECGSHVPLGDRAVMPRAKLGTDYVFCIDCYEWVAMSTGAVPFGGRESTGFEREVPLLLDHPAYHSKKGYTR